MRPKMIVNNSLNGDWDAGGNKNLPKGLWLSDDGKIFMSRCPECGLENYAMCVSSGTCAWCGYDATKDYGVIKAKDESKK